MFFQSDDVRAQKKWKIYCKNDDDDDDDKINLPEHFFGIYSESILFSNFSNGFLGSKPVLFHKLLIS